MVSYSRQFVYYFLEEFHVDDKNKRTECPECYSSVEAFFVSLEERWKVIYLCKVISLFFA